MTTAKSNLKSSVAGVVFNEDRSKVLLIKRRDVCIWVLPGGGVDPGETPEVAIVREFLEETGLSVRVKRQVALYTPINRLSNHSYLFECEVNSGNLSTGDETQGVDFFPLDALPTPLFFLHEEWIEDAKIPTSGIIKKPLSQITYFNLLKYFISHPLQVIRIALSRCGIPFNTNSP
jgi:ADP-ribose pyrophosphatase YjhB (NUDIX family)